MFSTDLKTKYPETTKFLTNAILKNKLANSYIFVGKEPEEMLHLVINLAKILNCQKNKNQIGSACDECLNCKWLEKKEHPHALIIVNPDPENKKEQIKIDIIRELLADLNTTSDYFRIVFFGNSNLNSLPAESCNLLLKTVEETPGRTLFIFANASKDDILPTIVSRSQLIHLNKNYDSINKMLKKNSVIPDENELMDIFPVDNFSAVNKAKKTLDSIQKEEIKLNDYLTFIASSKYDEYKHKNQKKYCFLYKNLSKAYLKYKSFMQPKIVMEDLFLDMVNKMT
ncbi:MAG: hypothetical protein A3B68_06785 [Candidatus Melainabacteria bacterium RIFCSPHIGHO2_02_FULL_34_12]|nr:MAG: hypothetical protein A3B68_06785 [Candidatus Melainabacteria bacterium RIFCSPHIGHO2_02_FULL_34_12]